MTALLNRALKGMDEIPFTDGYRQYHPKPSFGGVMEYSKYDLAKFVQTAFDGDLPLLEKMLDREEPIEGYHHDINQHYGEFNALHMAAANGQTEVVEMLLQARADPHVKRSMPSGQEPEDGETSTEIADKWGYDDIVEILKRSEASYPKGMYMRYGPKNNAKLWPMDQPEGLDPEQEKRAKAKLRGMLRPLPASKADFKFYGDAVFGLTHGYDEEGKVLKNKVVASASTSALVDQRAARTKCALLFPGKGSQYLKMMNGAASNRRVKEMLDYAEKVLGYDVLDVVQNGPEEKLESTEVSLPVLYLASLAAVETLRSEHPEAADRPGAVAGLSIGEYVALTIAGVMSYEDGLKLVKMSADAMRDASKGTPQAMLSIAGLEKTQVADLCRQASSRTNEICVIANELFPKGYTCSGSRSAIEELAALAGKTNGLLQSKILNTDTAFHSSYMEPARVKVERALMEALPRLKPPSCDIYLNSTGCVFRAGSDPKALIPLVCDQMVKPTLWEASVKAMIEDGLTEFYECGPMKQLKAMMKRIDQEAWGNTKNVEI